MIKEIGRYLLLICFFGIFFFSISAKAETNVSTTLEDTWFLDDIQAKEGWEYLSMQKITPESPIIVAVIDTGVDYTHPLFQNALWHNQMELEGIVGIDDDKNGYVDDIYGINTYDDTSNPMDNSVGSIEGHGTHVAGSILLTAGVTEQENPYQIQVMCLKAGDAYGNFSYQNVADAIYYAINQGASVINMSLSTTNCPKVLKDALLQAKKSAIIVSSAGNKGLSTSDFETGTGKDFYPAGKPYVVGVMSYNKYHTLSYFSNWDLKKYSGAEYEIIAPGEHIYSCYYEGKYKENKGTSMATGIVSGCAALLWKMYQQQTNYTAEDLTAHIMEYSGENISYQDNLGKKHEFHKLNLYKLLSSEIAPVFKMSEVSGETIADSQIALNYTLFHRGSSSKNIQTKITWSSEDKNFGEISLPQSEESIPPFEQIEKRLLVSLPETLKKNQTITFHVENFCEEQKVSGTFTYYYGVVPTIAEPMISLQGITVSCASPILKPGETTNLVINYIPENTTEDKTLTFVSDAPHIVSVDEKGVLTAYAQGKATITITTSNQLVRKLVITVYQSEIPTTTAPSISATPTSPNVSPTTKQLTTTPTVLPTSEKPTTPPTVSPVPTVQITPPEKKKKILENSVKISTTIFKWDGKTKKPVISIKGLKKNKDYKVSYSNSSSKNIGSYQVIIKGMASYTGTVKKTYRICGKKNSIYTLNGLHYKITSNTSSNKKSIGTVALVGSKSKKITKLTIRDTIKLGGKTYKITAIANRAFQKYKNLKTVVIGKNVKKIGAYAFDNNSNLKTITNKSRNISYIGKHAFRNVSKKAKITVFIMYDK